MTTANQGEGESAATEMLARALELPAEERSAYVRRACQGRPELQQRVERLLRDAVEYDPLFDGGILGGALVRDLARGGVREIEAGGRLGRYEILARLGSGGMGVVYRAHDPTLDRAVALKVLSSSMHADPERFIREARAASALSHPHIATVYEMGEDEGTIYIAMELVEGPSLHQRMREGRLPLLEAVRIAGQIAEALAAAHARGIVHRDLKPGNVVLCPERGVKLVDFGLAKRAPPLAAEGDAGEGSLTSSGMLLGTVGYMSPEQAGGLQVDFRSDQFSLGTLIYEMVAARHPFRAGSHGETLASILRDPAPPLRQDAPHAPRWLEQLVARCHAKDPAGRFAGTDELARLLRERGGAETTQTLGRTVCSGCGRTVSSAHRHCLYCGEVTVPPCQTCGGELSPGAAFCSHCGAAVAPHPVDEQTPLDGPDSDGAITVATALSGERRLATVVAARLAGHAELVDGVDPERRRRILAALERDAREAALAAGGRLLQFGRGELLMVFGLQGAAEDDARSAVEAAERLHAAFEERRGGSDGRDGDEEAPPPFASLCTGIYSGMVVTEPADGGGLTVTGPAVEAAARLAARAAEGEIRVSSETRRLCQGPRPQETGGERRTDGEPGTLSHFTGREAELATLLETVAATVRGEGRFVEVIGEAGSGKSRLLHELQRHADWSRCRLVEGRCQSYGAEVPYLPLVPVLRSLLGCPEGGSEEESVEAVRSALSALGSDLEPYLPLYLDLLSPSERQSGAPARADHEQHRHALQSAVVGAVSLSSLAEPLVVVLEDWHWVDEASHEVVRQLAELTSSHPLALIVSRRPEPPVSWPPLSSPTPVALRPIGLESAELLIRSILGGESLERNIAVALHARSGGNPFFLEELCRSLREEQRLERRDGELRLRNEVGSLELPPTVHALLRARLDRVTGTPRDVLRRAAVIGREFDAAVLEASLEHDVDLAAALEVLRARGLIRQLRVLPDSQYAFQHILVQEAAYESLLRHQRLSLHLLVGRAIERVHAGRIEEHLERLAQHFASAESWPEAMHYSRRAARRAADLSQLDDALAMLDRALEWAGRSGRESDGVQARVDLLLDKERYCDTLGWRDEQSRLIEELLTLLPPGRDQAKRVAVLVRKGELLAQLGAFAQAREALEEGRAASRALGDPVCERGALRGLAFACWHEQKLDEAVEHLRAALELDRRLEDPGAEAQDLANLGLTLRRLDRLEEALEVLDQALELNRRTKDAARETAILYMLSWVYRSLGDDESARRILLSEAATAKRPGGFVMVAEQSYQLIALANIALDHGQAEEALELLRQSVESCRTSRYRAGLAHSLRTLAETLIEMDRPHEALEAAFEAATLFSQLGDAASELRLRSIFAPLLDGLSAERAEPHWERLVDLAGRLQRTGPLTQGLLGLARLDQGRGDLESAHRRLVEALEACEGPRTDDSAARGRDLRGETLNELGILEWRLGRFEDALSRYREALEQFRQRGDRKHEGLMLNSIGATLRRLGRDDEAAAVLLQAETVHRDSGEELLRGHASALMGDLEADAGRWDEAVRWYEQSLDIRRAIGDRTGEGFMLLRLARAEHQREDGERAGARLAEAEGVATALGDEKILEECSRVTDLLGGRDA